MRLAREFRGADEFGLARSEKVDFGVRVGYQWTKTPMTDAYLKQRQFTSEGPYAELLLFGF